MKTSLMLSRKQQQTIYEIVDSGGSVRLQCAGKKIVRMHEIVSIGCVCLVLGFMLVSQYR